MDAGAVTGSTCRRQGTGQRRLLCGPAERTRRPGRGRCRRGRVAQSIGLPAVPPGPLLPNNRRDCDAEAEVGVGSSGGKAGAGGAAQLVLGVVKGAATGGAFVIGGSVFAAVV